jgi:hypothetical protein
VIMVMNHMTLRIQFFSDVTLVWIDLEDEDINDLPKRRESHTHRQRLVPEGTSPQLT